MGKKDIYTVDFFPMRDDVYTVKKFDQETGVQTEMYTVSDISETAMVCTCFAGTKSICRHRTMVRLFQAEDRIGKGWMYQYDKKEWTAPQTSDEYEGETNA